jgi:hypothetical protein
MLKIQAKAINSNKRTKPGPIYTNDTWAEFPTFDNFKTRPNRSISRYPQRPTGKTSVTEKSLLHRHLEKLGVNPLQHDDEGEFDVGINGAQEVLQWIDLSLVLCKYEDKTYLAKETEASLLAQVIRYRAAY